MGWTKVKDSLPGVGLASVDRVGLKKYGVLAIRRCDANVTVADVDYLMENPDEYTHWSYLPGLPIEEQPLTQKEVRGVRELLKRACL